MEEPIRILHVDDDPSFADMAATFVEGEDERLDVETATGAAEATDRLADERFDCVVSDYDMPRTDGLEFLGSVREQHPDLPFVLFTGKGSEEVASDALSAGATDYLRKGSGTDQYALLANRIGNAVEQYRAERRRATLERVRTIVNDVNQALIRASSRQEVEARVCEILSDADPYRFAVIAGVDPETERIEPRTWAGTGEGFLDEFEMSVAEGAPGRRAPGGRAFHEREVAVVQDIQTDPAYEQWRDLALEHGFQALAVVPLEYDAELYGLLAVLADRPSAFDGTEREVLAELADDVAHALHAREVRAELRESKHRLERYREYTERVIDAFDDLFFVHDEAGTLQRWNEAFAAVTGYTHEELATMNGTDFVPEDHRERAAAAIERVFETGHAKLEAPLLTKDGERIPYEYAADRVENPDGEPRLVGVGRDLSERTERERRLRRTNERLDEFASIVSHDLRNPLDVAQGQLQLASAECDSAHLDEVAGAHERMETLIDDLLTLARQGTTVEGTEPVALESAVERCWGNVETGEATIEVGTNGVIRADPDRLQQLLENLIRNAIEHGGGDVTVTIGELEANGFHVADDGPGIPEGKRQRVFDAGYSTADGGTGFGLVIVREIAEAHGWDVAVTGSEAGGARFEITGVDTVSD